MRTSQLLSVLVSLTGMVAGNEYTASTIKNTAHSISSFNTATCVRSSIAACPTVFNPCCAYICGEAQVPFEVCSPDDETGEFAACSKCPTGKATTSTSTHMSSSASNLTHKPSTSSTSALSHKSSTPVTRSHKTTASPSTHKPSKFKSTTAKSTTVKTTTHSATITTAPKTTLSASTCTVKLLSGTQGCPTPYDPCCAYTCAEAQVPFGVCSQTDGSGEYAVCSKCPTPTARL